MTKLSLMGATAVGRTLALVLMLICGSAAHADWHYGKILNMYFAYDGATFTITIEGYTRTNCTCYAPWPGHICLDRQHVSYKEQVAAVMLAKSQDRTVAVNVDEGTCRAIALGVN